MCAFTVKITSIRENDLKEILLIEQAAFTSPWSYGMFKEELASPLSYCRAARIITPVGKECAGYAIFKIIVDEAHILNIAVKDHLRKKGIASLLVYDMLFNAQRKDVEKIYLEVRPTNIPAINLYEKFGFVRWGLRRNYYTETGEDALIMVLGRTGDKTKW